MMNLSEAGRRNIASGISSWMPGSGPGMTPRLNDYQLVPPRAARQRHDSTRNLALSRVLLTNDANFPWLILVPRLPALVELIDLEENAQIQLLGEIAAAARALKNVTACDKLNIAALGNQVSQLHVHVIARRHSDAAWPKPVWGAAAPASYEPKLRDHLIDALRRALHVKAIGG